MPQFGINVDDSLANDIDAERQHRNEEAEGVVSRSDVCRDWLELGKIADDILDQYDVDEDDIHARKAVLRQALYDHLREGSD